MAKNCSLLPLAISLAICALGSCSHQPRNVSTATGVQPRSVTTNLRLATTSATHIGFLAALGQLDKVVAVTNRDLIYTPLSDSVIDLGDATTPNIERIIQAGVTHVIVSDYTGNRLTEQLDRVGISYTIINEWQETDPLRRAAWIQTFGDILDCRPLADSILAAVQQQYQQAVGSTSEAQQSSQANNNALRSIMTGMNYRGTWYVPSGNSYMGHLLRDAGADYPYTQEERQGSLPLTFETCFIQFRDAEVWIGSDARTLSELAAMDERHTWFRAWQTGRVYNWFKQTTPMGGNNFWERGVVHPEEILSDLIHILANDTTCLVYAQPLHGNSIQKE